MIDPVRVLLADDHPILLEALRHLIDASPDLRVVAVAHDGDAAVTAALLHRPDVIVLDISMPGGGLRTLARLGSSVPEARVVILSIHTEDAYVREAVRLGARGYLSKRGAGRDLLDAIRAAARGDAYLTPEAARTLLTPSPAEHRAELSAREQEVLGLTAGGLTNREIGERLSLSVKTVDTYRARAMAKLDLHHRSEVIAYAIGHGLLEGS